MLCVKQTTSLHDGYELRCTEQDLSHMSQYTSQRKLADNTWYGDQNVVL